ncbi:MAG: glycosyltransferase family 4 protein [Candidatus Andersenbacteria bacterium]|nr:glycosyltransferase family 4 protein [Candidatus Andersenbacteria bacterium]MBI3250264.1 glycosyltransferase family 4 protein [Candidatus Andersenbacteria bacterium]
MIIDYINNAPRYSGVGARAYRILQELQKMQIDQHLELQEKIIDPQQTNLKSWPGVLGSKSVGWVRLGRKYSKRAKADVFDITNQTMSFLARRLSPSVVTVHDIIELLEPQDKRAALLNKYLYSGIPRASHIIAVSEYTKQSIKEHYEVQGSKITVIPNGVGEEFYPIENFEQTIGYQELRQTLKLNDAHPIILYVGSDHPRKNVPIALEVFARLATKRPDAIFVKVGRPGIASGREETVAKIEELGIENRVRFLGDISDEKLNELYNLADVLLFPSRLEGFGLPPLQAMAAGLPVVSSNATSLPEVVGDAAILSAPNDVDNLLKGVERIIEDTKTAAEYRRRGLMRAKNFSWEKAARQVLGVYKKVAGI